MLNAFHSPVPGKRLTGESHRRVQFDQVEHECNAGPGSPRCSVRSIEPQCHLCHNKASADASPWYNKQMHHASRAGGGLMLGVWSFHLGRAGNKGLCCLGGVRFKWLPPICKGIPSTFVKESSARTRMHAHTHSDGLPAMEELLTAH